MSKCTNYSLRHRNRIFWKMTLPKFGLVALDKELGGFKIKIIFPLFIISKISIKY